MPCLLALKLTRNNVRETCQLDYCRLAQIA